MTISTEQTALDLMTIEEEARASGFLHLSYRGFRHLSLQYVFPKLVRLDVGHNQIKILPPQIGLLNKLEELWVNDNPLQHLPRELGNCVNLKILDLSSTRLENLPCELGKLEKIVEIDLRKIETLEPLWKKIYEEGSTKGLVSLLKHESERQNLKIQLTQDLKEGLYREIDDDPIRSHEISSFVEKVFMEFEDHGELKSLIRNQDRLFPPPDQIEGINLKLIREKFVNLRRDNEYKKCAASLELKLRAIYFDKIDPSSVEAIVKSLYAEIDSLKDIQFLIKHAKYIFPEEASDIQARLVFEKLCSYRKELQQKRETAINTVHNQLCSLYPLEPKIVKELTDAVCIFFKKVEDLKKLAADATVYFPSEFEQAMEDPQAIREVFVRKQKELDD